MANITDEPYRGAIADLRALQQPGLDTFRRYIHGDLPLPPIWRFTGMHPTEAGLGKATFSMPVTPWLADGTGVYWGGIYALFADSPLASAIWTTLPPAKVLTTSELNISYVRPLTEQTSSIIGHAETVHSGSQVGLSTVRISDHQGRTLAFGSSRCLIADFPVDQSEQFPPPDLGPTNPQDPYLRPVPLSDFCTLSEFGDATPIELQRATIREGRSHPIWNFTGYRATQIDDGVCQSTLPSSPWFSNGSFSINGGLLAWAADFTMGAAVYSTLPAGDIFANLDMHIRFTRPANIDSGPLTLTGKVHHRGRQLRVSSCEILNAEGKRVAMATGSALVLPGGARLLSEGVKPEDIIASATATQTSA
ncbi:PaaI family thioesterase [Microbulbifer sp. CAU 1566]|uniref:PaaI family thioesterase n=1 Tax=Microbulbifer sp. CAU 1566 TaxID=2933269 RepID=UPI0020058EBA|nr:PaaI family thioesterase [Microbulbifer sp. CAU 1566]MCK7597500.1 PaaI family thioesterase [Microbulbifer sp. CAU 1566]